MVKLEIPLFDHGQGPTAEKEAELFREQRSYQGLGVKLRASARATATRLQAARQTLTRYDQDILPIRAKILEQTELYYNAMGVDVFALLAAKNAIGHAELARTEARLNYELARVDLEQLLAGRMPPTTLPGNEGSH